MLSEEANRAAAQLEELGDFLSGDAFENLEVSQPTPPSVSASFATTGPGGSHAGHKKGIHHVVEVYLNVTNFLSAFFRIESIVS